MSTAIRTAADLPPHQAPQTRRRTSAVPSAPSPGPYRLAVTTGLDEVVDRLRGILGPSLVGLIAGVDRKTVQRWSPDRQPRHTTEQRLRAAWQIYGVLAEVEEPETIRQWFMGMNPDLGDLSPAEAIATDNHRATLAAARSFAADA